MSSSTLSIIDYILLVLLLLSATTIGVIFSFIKSKRNSAKEFLLGKFSIEQYLLSKFAFLTIRNGSADGNMSVFPTAMSIMVTFVSAITLLGTPSEVYASGTMFMYSGKCSKKAEY